MVRAKAHKKPNIRVPVVPKSRCEICLQNERSPYTFLVVPWKSLFQFDVCLGTTFSLIFRFPSLFQKLSELLKNQGSFKF
jgi:hypothetical protein